MEPRPDEVVFGNSFGAGTRRTVRERNKSGLGLNFSSFRMEN